MQGTSSPTTDGISPLTAACISIKTLVATSILWAIMTWIYALAWKQKLYILKLNKYVVR